MEGGRRVTVGRVTKPQGLTGEVRLTLYGGSVEVLEGLRHVTAVGNGTSRALTLESVEGRGQAVIARFAEVRDRTAAEALVGWDLEVPEAEIPALEPGAYYTYQLEGLEVVTEAGERLGVLEEVLDLPAHDVYVVRAGDRQVLIPATEEVVREVDLEKGRMVIHLLEGLLD
jgi:16S rRNA processing protein RimM